MTWDIVLLTVPEFATLEVGARNEGQSIIVLHICERGTNSRWKFMPRRGFLTLEVNPRHRCWRCCARDGYFATAARAGVAVTDRYRALLCASRVAAVTRAEVSLWVLDAHTMVARYWPCSSSQSSMYTDVPSSFSGSVYGGFASG
jgi:hypothetical protein